MSTWEQRSLRRWDDAEARVRRFFDGREDAPDSLTQVVIISHVVSALYSGDHQRDLGETIEALHARLTPALAEDPA